MPEENQLSQEVGYLLKSKWLWLATAESCTGGLLGSLITNISGSSEYYLGGFITYSNFAKERFLNVKPETLKSFGAVSRETVLEMACGVRYVFKDEQDVTRIIGVSISGIAGPGGGTPEKPVGTVWIGISSQSGKQASSFNFSGDRVSIKNQTSLQALKLLFSCLSQ
jgi:nicotinamide-nucleotide amidase